MNVVKAGNVLTNDTDADGDTLTVVIPADSDGDPSSHTYTSASGSKLKLGTDGSLHLYASCGLPRDESFRLYD